VSAPNTHRDAATVRLRRQTACHFGQGCRAAIVLPAWVVGCSLLGLGALGHDIGLPLWVVMLSTPLIWAGPAQFVLFGSLAAGMALVSIALAVSLTSMRLLPMGISILALLRGRDRHLATRILLAHLVVVSTWVEGMRLMPHMPQRNRLPWFLGFSFTCIVVSTLMTGLGHMLSASLPRYLAAGFMFLTPLFFSLTLIAGARKAPDIAAIALGVVLGAVLGPVVGPDFDLLAAGVGGGLAAYALHRFRR